MVAAARGGLQAAPLLDPEPHLATPVVKLEAWQQKRGHQEQTARAARPAARPATNTWAPNALPAVPAVLCLLCLLCPALPTKPLAHLFGVHGDGAGRRQLLQVLRILAHPPLLLPGRHSLLQAGRAGLLSLLLSVLKRVGAAGRQQARCAPGGVLLCLPLPAMAGTPRAAATRDQQRKQIMRPAPAHCSPEARPPPVGWRSRAAAPPRCSPAPALAARGRAAGRAAPRA